MLQIPLIQHVIAETIDHEIPGSIPDPAVTTRGSVFEQDTETQNAPENAPSVYECVNGSCF